jgi:DNA polymerase-3 subunit delta
MVELEGAQLKFTDLVNVCSSIPFLADHRLVVVRGLLGRFQPAKGGNSAPQGKRKQGSGAADEWSGLAAYVGNMPPTTDLVLLEDRLTAENTIFVALKPVAEVQQFEPLSGDPLRKWTEHRVRSQGGEIANAAVALLEQWVGGDLWAMSNELAKLMTYCGSRAITDQDVRSLAVHTREENIFRLVDAILDGHTDEAERSFSRLTMEGTPALGVAAMINRQLRLAVRAKSLGDIPEAELGSRLGISGFPLKKTHRQARAYSWVRLRTAYRRLVEMDLAIKTGKCDGDLAMALYIADLRSHG